MRKRKHDDLSCHVSTYRIDHSLHHTTHRPLTPSPPQRTPTCLVTAELHNTTSHVRSVQRQATTLARS